MQFSESAIYRHFHSKEDIIVVMLSYLSDCMDKLLAKAVQSEYEQLKASYTSKKATLNRTKANVGNVDLRRCKKC